MRKYGLIGYPLGHSFSEKYFREKFIAENISDCSYHNYPINDISKFPILLKEHPDLCGLNITIPYKTLIMNYIDISDRTVSEIGAVNVLKIKRDGSKTEIFGFNSDVTGIAGSVLPCKDPGMTDALILGTGGSSKAVAWTLKNMGINVTFVSRQKKPGLLTYSDIDARITDAVQLIVNTTPLGMFPDTGSKPALDYDFLDERHTLFDLVYNPEMTAFLKTGQERGCRIITGLKMLYLQAEKSWEIWNNDDL